MLCYWNTLRLSPVVSPFLSMGAERNKNVYVLTFFFFENNVILTCMKLEQELLAKVPGCCMLPPLVCTNKMVWQCKNCQNVKCNHVLTFFLLFAIHCCGWRCSSDGLGFACVHFSRWTMARCWTFTTWKTETRFSLKETVLQSWKRVFMKSKGLLLKATGLN